MFVSSLSQKSSGAVACGSVEREKEIWRWLVENIGSGSPGNREVPQSVITAQLCLNIMVCLRKT